MLIIPAIDIRSARVVRLLQGDFTKETFYSSNPVEVALNWQSQGARLLHVVDLDGAMAGRPQNLPAITDMVNHIGIPVQMGGGLRTGEDIDSVLSKGVDRVIIGTKAYSDGEFLVRLVQKYGDKIVVGIDAAGDNVVIKGWTSATGAKATELAKRVEAAGVKTIIYTNVLRDGTLEKPQFDMIEKIADAVDIDIIASGGVSSIDDIRDIKRLLRPNISGVIVGKALYEGRLNLKDAIDLAKE